MANALKKSMGDLPAQLWRSLTWDRGKELSDHVRFTIGSGVKVFFADPHSPWQRLILAACAFQLNPLAVSLDAASNINGQQHHVSGDTVFSRSTLVATARASGISMSFPMLQDIRIRDGKISEFRPFYWDTATLVPLFDQR